MKVIDRILTIVLLFLSISAAGAEVYTPEDVPNVNVSDRREYVSDPAGLVSGEVKSRINARLDSLRKSLTVEAAVVVVPSIGDEPIEDFSEELFTSWGIGKKDKDNGLLLLLVPEDKKVRIQTGYGLEGVMTDIVCSRIINNTIVPAMKEDDINRALDASTSLIVNVVSDPSVAEELKSEQSDDNQIPGLSAEVFWQFLRIVGLVGFLFTLSVFCYDLVKIRGRRNYDRALSWRRHLPMYFWGALCSLGTALPFALIALFLYRGNRTRHIKCDTCGSKMNRLPEDEDNKYLSLSQDFEEKIKSVDYDVWVCPECGTIERFPYKERQTKYSECPQCHTVAMRLKCDKVIIPPTTRQEGVGERIYECEFCHHQRRDRYRIPRRSDGSGALAAGAAIGSALGRGGGGGGFGGGFGGGSTGGGGATGGW